MAEEKSPEEPATPPKETENSIFDEAVEATPPVPVELKSELSSANTTFSAELSPESIEVVEKMSNLEILEEENVELLFGETKKSSKKSFIFDEKQTLKNVKLVAESSESDVLSAVDYSLQTTEFQEDEPAKIIEKPPAIGQLKLKELLSETSMRIVEYAQKLAEAPLIGTVPEPESELATAPPVGESKSTAPSAGESRITAPSTGESRITASSAGESKSAAPSAGVSRLPAISEDRFPGLDRNEIPRVQVPSSTGNVSIFQEGDATDEDFYEIYTIPEGIDKSEEVPAVVRNFLQIFQDEKQPIAKILKLEDEDKLNEAAGWDIQPSFRSTPDCVIRCSVLEKILKGILEFRLSKTTMNFEGRQAKMTMEILSEDVASTLSQLRFPRYKFGYFITLLQKNHQDVIVSTRQLWDPETDRRVIAKLETREFHASVIVHFIFHP